MKTYSETFSLLRESLVGSDFIILLAAIFATVLMALTIVLTRILRDSCKKAQTRSKSIPRIWIGSTEMAYNLFVTMITIFPLLGMLGTVFGLLGLDLANGDMNNIKNNFFIALTSTAWGIIFSVIFKLFHAVFAGRVEEQIVMAKKMIDEEDQ